MSYDIEYLEFLGLVSKLALYRDVISSKQDAAIRECVVALVTATECPDAHAVAVKERNRIHRDTFDEFGRWIVEPDIDGSDRCRVRYLVADAIRWLCEFNTAHAWDCLLSAERY
jgi:hypothetical protein